MKKLTAHHKASSQSPWAIGLFTMSMLTACGGGGDGPTSPVVDTALRLPRGTAHG